MRLLEIVVRAPIIDRELRKIKCKQYWVATQYARAELITDEGTWVSEQLPGWVWDRRSGSRTVDLVVPKSGSDAYNAVLAGHDTSYSGWMSRALSDDLFVRQGFALSGDVGRRMSAVAYRTVRLFGWPGYYDLGAPMPEPYAQNRGLERLYLVDKA